MRASKWEETPLLNSRIRGIEDAMADHQKYHCQANDVNRHCPVCSQFERALVKLSIER